MARGPFLLSRPCIGAHSIHDKRGLPTVIACDIGTALAHLWIEGIFALFNFRENDSDKAVCAPLHARPAALRNGIDLPGHLVWAEGATVWPRVSLWAHPDAPNSHTASDLPDY